MMFAVPAAREKVHDHLIFGRDVRRLGSEIFGVGGGQHFHVVLESLQVLYLESDMIEARPLVFRPEVVLDPYGARIMFTIPSVR